jgi:hypothetical protein
MPVSCIWNSITCLPLCVQRWGNFLFSRGLEVILTGLSNTCWYNTSPNEVSHAANESTCGMYTTIILKIQRLIA